jgi:hypothetical protein
MIFLLVPIVWIANKILCKNRKAQAAWSAREENRGFPQKAPFAFRGKSSFSQRASRWSWTIRKAQAAWLMLVAPSRWS